MYLICIIVLYIVCICLYNIYVILVLDADGAAAFSKRIDLCASIKMA